MAKVLKVPASDKMVADLEELRQMLGASSQAEAIRRAIASEVLLRRKLKEVKSLRLKGEQGAGEEIDVLMT